MMYCIFLQILIDVKKIFEVQDSMIDINIPQVNISIIDYTKFNFQVSDLDWIVWKLLTTIYVDNNQFIKLNTNTFVIFIF